MSATLPRATAPLFDLLAEHTRRICLPHGDTPAERRTITNLAIHFSGGDLTQEQRQALLDLCRSPVRELCPPEVYALRILAFIAEATGSSSKLTVELRLDAAQFRCDLEACIAQVREVSAELDHLLDSGNQSASDAQ